MLRLEFIGLGLVVIGALTAGVGIYRRTAPSDIAQEGVEVVELVRSLKKQLVELQEEGRESPFLEMKGAQLEVNFVVTRSLSTDGRIGWQAITLGTKNEDARERSNKIVLDLLPVTSYRGNLTKHGDPHE